MYLKNSNDEMVEKLRVPKARARLQERGDRELERQTYLDPSRGTTDKCKEIALENGENHCN